MTRLIRNCEIMTRLICNCESVTSLIGNWESRICVTRLIRIRKSLSRVREMTDSHVRHDSFMCVA